MIELTSIKYDRKIRQISEPLLHNFGISYFCYQFVSNDGNWFTLGTNPDWLIHSATNKYFEADPSLARPSYYSSPYICFPKYHENQRFQETLINQAIELFDLDHALAIVNPTDKGCEYYFFGAPKNHVRVFNIYVNQLDKLRRDYTQYMKTEFQSILPLCHNNSINLNKVNPKRYHSSNDLLQDDMKGLENDFMLSIKFSPLTKQEQQCLSLYQQGLTAKETARLLRRSHRTIEGYFEVIKNKYGVTCKRDLLNSLLYT